MRWLIHDERTSHLGNFRIFLFFNLSPRSAPVCYRKCCRFLLPPPPSNFCFLLLFKMEKRSGGKPGYPPRRVSQHENTFIFGEFYINWVLTKSKWNREREKRSKQIRHEKDCNKTMPLELQFFFLSHSYANWSKTGSKRKIWSEMTDGIGV